MYFVLFYIRLKLYLYFQILFLKFCQFFFWILQNFEKHNNNNNNMESKSEILNSKILIIYFILFYICLKLCFYFQILFLKFCQFFFWILENFEKHNNNNNNMESKSEISWIQKYQLYILYYHLFEIIFLFSNSIL